MDAGTPPEAAAVSLRFSRIRVSFGIINNNSRVPAKELQEEAVKNI